MSEPQFLSLESVLDFHAEQLGLFGGPEGYNPALLESALAAPQNLYLYDDEADIFDCATAYAFHISKNHAFTDGNKRTGLEACLAFLKLNGLVTVVPNMDLLYAMMMALTESRCPKEDFATFLSLCCITPWISQATLEPTTQEAEQMFAIFKQGERTIEHLHAIFIDYITSKVRMILIEKCEKFCVNAKRVDDVPEQLEAQFFPQVEAKLRRQFGMDCD